MDELGRAQPASGRRYMYRSRMPRGRRRRGDIDHYRMDKQNNHLSLELGVRRPVAPIARPASRRSEVEQGS